MPNRRNFYKDMEKYRITRNAQRKRYYNKTSFIYENREWTPEEERQVILHEISDTELSSKIRRSVCAIQKRRCMLKKKYNII